MYVFLLELGFLLLLIHSTLFNARITISNPNSVRWAISLFSEAGQVRKEQRGLGWNWACISCLESVTSVQLHLVAAELNGFKSHLRTVNTCLSHNLFCVMCFAFLCFLLISQLKLAPSIVLSSYLVFQRIRKLWCAEKICLLD